MTLRERVQNGEITERGFAREIGISQSHMHNVVWGVRDFTVPIADRILWGLGLSVVDLLEAGESRRGVRSAGTEATLGRKAS